MTAPYRLMLLATSLLAGSPALSKSPSPPEVTPTSKPDSKPNVEVQDHCPHSDMQAAGEASEPPPKSGAHVQRGQAVQGAPEVALEKLVKSPQTYAGKQMIVAGTVHRACERRGCWMELTDSSGAHPVRITFKDYAFFVPTQSAGARARVLGQPKLVQLTEGVAEHYRSEGATASAKSPEVQFVASGVELTFSKGNPTP